MGCLRPIRLIKAASHDGKAVLAEGLWLRLWGGVGRKHSLGSGLVQVGVEASISTLDPSLATRTDVARLLPLPFDEPIHALAMPLVCVCVLVIMKLHT